MRVVERTQVEDAVEYEIDELVTSGCYRDARMLSAAEEDRDLLGSGAQALPRPPVRQHRGDRDAQGLAVSVGPHPLAPVVAVHAGQPEVMRDVVDGVEPVGPHENAHLAERRIIEEVPSTDDDVFDLSSVQLGEQRGGPWPRRLRIDVLTLES